jgi:hypothetical protein
MNTFVDMDWMESSATWRQNGRHSRASISLSANHQPRRRYDGLLPRGWTATGQPLKWTGDEKSIYSTAGAYAIEPLVKAYQLTGKTKYLSTAVEMLEAYSRHFGEDLAEPFWGGTNDAGCEDAVDILML